MTILFAIVTHTCKAILLSQAIILSLAIFLAMSHAGSESKNYFFLFERNRYLYRSFLVNLIWTR